MFDNCYRYTHTVIYYVNKQCTVSGYVCTMTPCQLIFITGPNLCCKGNHFDYEHLSPSGTLLTCDWDLTFYDLVGKAACNWLLHLLSEEIFYIFMQGVSVQFFPDLQSCFCTLNRYCYLVLTFRYKMLF